MSSWKIVSKYLTTTKMLIYENTNFHGNTIFNLIFVF